MKAFILAAGYGKRMGPLTERCPKPLLPLAGYPLIYYTLFQLHRWAVDSAMINVHYLGEQIETALMDFPHFPLHFSRERNILGTAGGVRKALDLGYLEADEWCLLVNPDTLLWPTPADAPATPKPSGSGAGADGVLYLKPRQPDNPATGFDFSPTTGTGKDLIHMNAAGNYYYIGYALVRGGSVAGLPPDSFAELGPVWQAAAAQNRLRGRLFAGELFDVGTRESYEQLVSRQTGPIPAEWRAEWRDFLAAWPGQPTPNQD